MKRSPGCHGDGTSGEKSDLAYHTNSYIDFSFLSFIFGDRRRQPWADPLYYGVGNICKANGVTENLACDYFVILYDEVSWWVASFRY